MSLAAKLAADEVVLTCWSGVPDSVTVELMAGAKGFDAVTMDMQHGAHHEDSILRSLPVIMRADKPAIVRIPVGRWDMASRALDFGADAVIAPMVNSVADARLFAAAMKYPPIGERSWGPTFAFPRYGKGTTQQYLEETNGRTVSFAMIETRAALEALDGILATPGIDAIFLGPSDFSIAWTRGKQINPTLEDMMDTVADVARRARAAGKHCGIYVMDSAVAGRYVDMGYRFLACGSEGQLIGQGAAVVAGAVLENIGKR